VIDCVNFVNILINGWPEDGLLEAKTCSHPQYLLTPRSRVLEKLTGLKLVKKVPAFYWTRRFITAFTSARHLSLSSASPIQSIAPHPTSWRSILIICPLLRLGLPSGLFPSGSPPKPYYRRLCPPHPLYMPRPSHSSVFYHPYNIGWGVQIMKFITMKFSPLPCYLVGPNVLLNTL
jgi:hypothetical protein